MKAKFTGHDTFPLRYGWLFKAVNYLKNNGKLQTSNEEIVRKAIVELGVGKNMVNAIRYWAESCGVVEQIPSGSSVEHKLTDLGASLFEEGVKGHPPLDPYLEYSGSIWLIHFLLNFNATELTAYRYFFNYAHVQSFEKTKLLDDFSEDVLHLTRSEHSNAGTLKKDVDCFINTYCTKRVAKKAGAAKVDEDYFTSPLAELDLLKDAGGGHYIASLQHRPSLPVPVFVYALLRFIAYENKESNATSIDFDSLLSSPLSPGRIFRLSESGLGEKLDAVEKFTKKQIRWVDSLGLRQVSVDEKVLRQPEDFIYQYYKELGAYAA